MTGKTERGGGVWHLDLVVKRLHYINFLDPWAINYATF